MGRSYLYQGRDTEALTPQERMLERLYDRLDTPSNRLTATQFFQTPEASALLDQLYGGLSDRLPPGSQIVSQTPGKITYRDPEGFEHNLIRKPDGQFTETTNRPAVLPDKSGQSTLDMLRARVEQGLTAKPTLAELDPQSTAALQTISDAEQAALNAGLSEDEARLVASLYGRGVNRSSIATGAASRFAEGAGRVRQQQRSDAATRLLGLRQFLTSLTQQNKELETNLYANLTGQGNQRDIAGAGLDVELKRLAEGSRQFNASNYLEQLRTQIEQEKLDTSRGPLAKVLGISQAAANFANAAGGGLGAYNALIGRK